MRALIAQLRPLHWIKNCLVLAPFFFSFSFNYPSLVSSLLALLSFCFMASAVYGFNDLLDLERDKVHPVKRNRPLAAGLITRRQAKALCVILVILGLAPLCFLPLGVAATMAAYLGVNLGYSLGWKSIPIVDVMIVALGFVLRVVAGALAIGVYVSHWILLCTFFLALFSAFGKRKDEMTVLSVGDRSKHRKSSGEYTETFIDQVLVLTAGIALVFYVLYTIDPVTIARFGGDELVYTSPIVVYVLFRYLFLLYNKGKGGDPVTVLTTDTPIILAFGVWVLSLVSIYLFHFA